MRQWRYFEAATLIAIFLNGSRPVMYGARIGEEGAGWVYAPFVLLQTMTCAQNRRAGTSLPLEAAQMFCSELIVTIPQTRSRPYGEWQENRWRGGSVGVVTQQSTRGGTAIHTPNLPPGLVHGKREGGGGGGEGYGEVRHPFILGFRLVSWYIIMQQSTR